jgi:hypothetical protein
MVVINSFLGGERMIESLKKCSKCLVEKPLECFFNHKISKDGKRSFCKECKKQQQEVWYRNNKKSTSETNKKWRENNLDRLKHLRVEWKKKNPNYHNDYMTDLYRTNSNFRIVNLLRNRFRKIVKRNHKEKSVLKLVGCSIEDFRNYIESKFLPGMSWENHGVWHLDHIIPCEYFTENIQDIRVQEQCFHFTNYQPLYSSDNFAKNDVLPRDFNLRYWIDSELGWQIVPYAG